jgi:hypothetical protein
MILVSRNASIKYKLMVKTPLEEAKALPLARCGRRGMMAATSRIKRERKNLVCGPTRSVQFGDSLHRPSNGRMVSSVHRGLGDDGLRLGSERSEHGGPVLREMPATGESYGSGQIRKGSEAALPTT